VVTVRIEIDRTKDMLAAIVAIRNIENGIDD
jgi:hypothetical protein